MEELRSINRKKERDSEEKEKEEVAVKAEGQSKERSMENTTLARILG